MFQRQSRLDAQQTAPLAERMRPRNFSEFVGQEQVVGPERVLFRALTYIKETGGGRLPSFILWGPPGSGKTTLARLIAAETQAAFEPVSAVTSGVADLRRIIAQANDRRGMHGQATILFVDEIHRFNKAQQDVILPHVENGAVTFIGATTENPSFEVIAPLLSRSRVFPLQSLAPQEVAAIINRAAADHERGLGQMAVTLAPDALTHLVNIANGDARIALNALETAAFATRPNPNGNRTIDLPTIADALQRRSPQYDKAGDSHYDTISAFIKSVRGSSPDGALYWLARMLESGEDPLFIARRLIILASEDIGLADPQALTIAVAAQQAAHFIGMPEARIPLAQAAVYLAAAPKSNTAYAALNQATADVRNLPNDPVPLHLRNAVTPLMQQLNYGQNYQYAHDHENHFTPQEYLPPNLKNRQYYHPGNQGHEPQIAQRLSRWWRQ